MRSPESDDWQLLNEYATQNSEGAFRALVDRYAGIVYHAALRQTANPSLAEEVTQAVFIALAQKAGKISQKVLLGGWLFRATRYAVLNLTRAERSRARRENEAVAMQATLSSNDEAHPVWEHISPSLDEALTQLSEADREAIIIRYFRNKSHRETGLALGVTEVAAKKRLSRALERLRRIFTKRGVVVPPLALVAAFSACAAKAAPSGLAASAAATALAHAAGGIVSSPLLATTILGEMARAKLKAIAATALVSILFVIAAGNFFHQRALSPLAPPAALIPKAPEPPPGRIVVWDKRLNVPPTLTVADATLEKALDNWSVRASAYWTVDYVVYDSDDALRRLLETLRSGASLQSCGWTNLGGARVSPGSVSVVNQSNANADPAASAQPLSVSQQHEAIAVTAVLNDPDAAQPTVATQQAIQQAIDQSRTDGAADGILAPERLLADVQVVPRFAGATALTATRDCAARLARDSHALWTIIYTLRRSPIQNVGFKLVHRDLPHTGPEAAVPSSEYMNLGSAESNRFELNADEIAAHNQAVKNWIDRNLGGQGRAP